VPADSGMAVRAIGFSHFRSVEAHREHPRWMQSGE
jgi:hypothetical protein